MPNHKLTTARIAALLRDRVAGLYGDGSYLWLQVSPARPAPPRRVGFSVIRRSARSGIWAWAPIRT